MRVTLIKLSNLTGFVTKLLISIALVLILHNQAHAQRGCCSWHGGVNYCDKSVGRMVCSDGTHSPSCLCEKAASYPAQEKYYDRSLHPATNYHN